MPWGPREELSDLPTVPRAATEASRAGPGSQPVSRPVLMARSPRDGNEIKLV